MRLRTGGFRIELLAAAGAAGILVWLLFASPFIGMADNGDFLRVLMTSGLDYSPAATSDQERFFQYANEVYGYADIRGAYVTSQLIPVMIARGIGWIFDSSVFHIRYLAGVYSVLMVAAVYQLVRAARRYSLTAGAALAAGVLFLFLDIRYAAYFNSFFAEPVSLLFLLLAAAFGLSLAHQEEPEGKALLGFFFCVFMLVCSKLQNMPLGIAFALYGLRFVPLRLDQAWRRLVLGCCSALLLASVLLYVFSPGGLKHINIYQTVFYGILNDSPDVKGDLKALGLPESLAVNAGTNYFQQDASIKQDAPEMKAAFYDRMSHGKVLMFYAAHPGRLVSLLERAAKESMTLKIDYLGNYPKPAGKEPGALTGVYSGWSKLKASFVPSSLLFIVLFYLLFYAVCLLEWMRARERSDRLAAEVLMLIGFVGLFAFIIPVVGDGLADIAKHLFLFNAAFDMMLLASLTWLVNRIAAMLGFARRDRGWSGYGS